MSLKTKLFLFQRRVFPHSPLWVKYLLDGPIFRFSKPGGGGGMLDRSRGGGDDGGHGYTYGLSPQFLDSLNISGPIHNRIFVANLDYKVDERKLKEVFR